MAGNLKIVKFRTASRKTLITSAGLGFKQRFFFNKNLNNKLYEYEAIFEQLFSLKSYSTSKQILTIYFIHTIVKASLSNQ